MNASPQRMTKPRRALLAALLLTTWTTAWPQAEAHTAEYRIKAAFLCKFVNYVEWPSEALPAPGNPLVIGVVARTDVGDEIERAAQTVTFNGRPIAVHRLKPGNALAGVQLLFIDQANEDQLPGWLQAARGHSVLTVTESRQALALGSAVNFVVIDDKVRFDVALRSAELSGLRISARLLGVARNVVADGRS